MPASPHIFLVHGFTRTRHDMWLMARRVRKLLPHSHVHVFGYPSRKLALRDAAQNLSRFVTEHSRDEHASFIGHSLGGLIVRALEEAHPEPTQLQRLVTLGTPHQGSSVARLLAPNKIFRALGGPVFHDLAAPKLSPTPSFLQVGCVIGHTNTPIGFIPFLKGDNDGLVSVHEAVFPACQAEIRAPIFHGLFPFSSQATRLAVRFLEYGTFEK